MRFLIFCAFVFFSLQLNASKLPDDLLMVAFDGESWYPYLVVDSQWEKITAIRDPAYLTWKPRNKTFYIKGDDGDLYQYSMGGKTLQKIPLKDKQNFTQLRSYKDGVAMVHLVDGKSRDTEIMSLDDSGALKSVLRQASAQFHPIMVDDYLYYAHVSCRMECKPIVQDVWRKNVITGKTEQITRWNATSYLHTLSKSESGNTLFGIASSNAAGFYHIYYLDIKSGMSYPLTHGAVTDSFPVLTSTHDLYFIRRDLTGSHLKYVSSSQWNNNASINEGLMETIVLPKEIKKIRYLELSDQ